MPVKSFNDLLAWQVSHKLSLDVYKITRKLPVNEQFGLVAQMRRSAISVSSNIAEGFGRRTTADKARFYQVAMGSLFELNSQIVLCRDLQFLDIESCQLVEDHISHTGKILNGLIRSTKKLSNS